MNRDHLRRARRMAPVRGALLLGAVLLLGTVAVLTDTARERPVAPAPSTSPPAMSSLAVAQTSTMVGLAPDLPPLPIFGRVVNIGQVAVGVAAVHVEISSVTPGSNSPEGACAAADYHLENSRMPVGRTLEPGDSVSFTGASIRFRATATNQDGCQLATVHLRYTTSAD